MRTLESGIVDLIMNSTTALTISVLTKMINESLESSYKDMVAEMIVKVSIEYDAYAIVEWITGIYKSCINYEDDIVASFGREGRSPKKCLDSCMILCRNGYLSRKNIDTIIVNAVYNSYTNCVRKFDFFINYIETKVHNRKRTLEYAFYCFAGYDYNDDVEALLFDLLLKKYEFDVDMIVDLVMNVFLDLEISGVDEKITFSDDGYEEILKSIFSLPIDEEIKSLVLNDGRLDSKQAECIARM